MTEYCTRCKAILNEGDRFCGSCGAPVEPVKAAAEPAVYSEPADLVNDGRRYQPVGAPVYRSADEEAQPSYSAAFAVPLQDQPRAEKKKSKKGLFIGVGVCVVVIAAAVAALFLFVFNGDAEVRSALTKHQQAYKNRDFREYYSHTTLALTDESGQEAVISFHEEMFQMNPELFTKNAEKNFKTLSVYTLGGSERETAKEELRLRYPYVSVQKISDVKTLTVLIEKSGEIDVQVITAIKYDGQWYFNDNL